MDARFNYRDYACIGLFVRGAFGDLILAVPLANAIRIISQHARIVLVCDDRTAQLAKFFDVFDDVLIIKARVNPYIDLLSFKMTSKIPEFDLMFAAKVGTGTQNGLWPKSFGAKQIVSYLDPLNPNWSDRFISDPVQFERACYTKQHYSLGVLNLGFNVNVKELPISLYPSLGLKHSYGKGIDRRYVVVDVHNPSDVRKPSLEVLRQFIDLFTNSYSDVFVILSCLRSDRPFAETLVSMLMNNSVKRVSISSGNGIQDLLLLLNKSIAVIGGDGGLLHMASALNVPVVGIFHRRVCPTWLPLNIRSHNFIVDDSVKEVSGADILGALEPIITAVESSDLVY